MSDPADTQDSADPLIVDGLSKIALNPLTIRKMFLLLLRAHYSDAENFGALKERMAQFVWSKDETAGQLYIEYDYRFDASKKDRRPAIFCGTSDFNYLATAVNNTKETLDDRSGEQSGKFISTTVIVRHVGKNAEDSLALAELTAAYFMGIRTMLQERVKVSKFDVVKLVTSRPFERTSEQQDEQFYADLIAEFSYVYIWNTIRESHRIKTIGFKSALELFST